MHNTHYIFTTISPPNSPTHMPHAHAHVHAHTYMHILQLGTPHTTDGIPGAMRRSYLLHILFKINSHYILKQTSILQCIYTHPTQSNLPVIKSSTHDYVYHVRILMHAKLSLHAHLRNSRAGTSTPGTTHHNMPTTEFTFTTKPPSRAPTRP